jgi:hypothetical protein
MGGNRTGSTTRGDTLAGVVLGGMHFGEDAGWSLVCLLKKIVPQALELPCMASKSSQWMTSELHGEELHATGGLKQWWHIVQGSSNKNIKMNGM